MNLVVMEKPSPSREHEEKNEPCRYNNPSHSVYSLRQSRRGLETTNGRTHDDPAEATSILSLHSRETEGGTVQGSNSAPTPSSRNPAFHENASVERVRATEISPHPLKVGPVSFSQPQYALESSTEPFPDYDEACEIDPLVSDRAYEEAYNYALSQELVYGRQREAEYLHTRQEVGAECSWDPAGSPSICSGQSTKSTDLLTEANLCAHPETTWSCQAVRANTPEQVSGPVDSSPTPAAAIGGSPVAPSGIPVTRSSSLGSTTVPESTPESGLVVPPAGSQNRVDPVFGGDISSEPGCENNSSLESGSRDQDSIQIDSAAEGDTSTEPEYLSNTDIMSYIPMPGADDECQSLLEEMRRLLQSPEMLYRHSKLYSEMSTHVLTVAHICLRRFMMDPCADYDAFLRPAEIHSLRPSLARLADLAEHLSVMLWQELKNVNDLVREVEYESREDNVAPMRRFVNVAETIVENLYLVEPIELRVFEVFHRFFFVWLYNDFCTFRMLQAQVRTVPDPDHITVTDTMMNICDFLNGTWDYYQILAASYDRIRRDVLVPMASRVPNGFEVWNCIFDQSQQMRGGRCALDELELFRRRQKLQAWNAHLAGLHHPNVHSHVSWRIHRGCGSYETLVVRDT